MRRHGPGRLLCKVWIATALALPLGGCASAHCLTGEAATRSHASDASVPVPNLFEVQQQFEEYITSGRYDTDCARVARAAQSYLEQRASVVTKPAIVLDIDDTSLSNWPAYKVNGWGRILNGECNLQQGPCGLRAWQQMEFSKALQPTLQLAKRAKALGVAVFFLSGRPPALRESTEKNLRAQGFEWDEVIIYPEGAQFASAVDFKAPQRRKIAERGCTIVLNMGDQKSDLEGGYAERTFKLPNPVYFLP